MAEVNPPEQPSKREDFSFSTGKQPRHTRNTLTSYNGTFLTQDIISLWAQSFHKSSDKVFRLDQARITFRRLDEHTEREGERVGDVPRFRIVIGSSEVVWEPCIENDYALGDVRRGACGSFLDFFVSYEDEGDR